MDPNLKEITRAIQWAKENFEKEGSLEIDEPSDNPHSQISACDNWREEGGFYVKAWIWVPYYKRSKN